MVGAFKRTILDETASHLIFLVHKSQIQGCSISNFVIRIIKASGKKHVNASLKLGVFLPNTEFGQCSDRCCSDERVLENNTVVDVADVFRRVRCLWSLDSERVQNADGQLRELTVLDELA